MKNTIKEIEQKMLLAYFEEEDERLANAWLKIILSIDWESWEKQDEVENI